MEYIEIKDYIIIGHYCGEIPDEKNPTIEYREVENCIANIGEDIRFYSDLSAGIKKPLKALIAEKLITIPEGKKLNEAGTDFVDMTDAEKVAAGFIQLKPDEKIEGEHIVKKTEKEKHDDRLISKEAYNAFIDTQRQAAYKQESDPLGMQVLRGELDKAEWLAKIAE
ncbi:MAG: hypothetical protein ACTTI6_05740 [Treponema sp.]|uniref:hypothetical protein n=1 Tax=Treponema sp. TaxID=166 RepID=UPI003FA2F63A